MAWLYVIGLCFVARSVYGQSVVVDLSDAETAACGDPFNEGYISGSAFTADGGDCCSFVVCDATNANKTGFIGKCMGGLAWNQNRLICDDPAQLAFEGTNCDPETECNVPKRTTGLCGTLADEATQCCVNGRLPQYEIDGDDSSVYSIIGEGKPIKCPGQMEFNVDDCCCENPGSPFVAPCDGSLDTLFYSLPDNDKDGQTNDAMDKCCSYAQCFPNRTAYEVVPCMPPSVWNDDTKACDLPVNVPACQLINCGAEMFDEPCPNPDTLPADQCCIAGVIYSFFPGGAQEQYYVNRFLADSDSNLELEIIRACPPDMMGNGTVFKPDICSCELP